MRAFILAFALLASCTSTPIGSGTQSTSIPLDQQSTSASNHLSPGSGCRSGNPLENVYRPQRLKLISRCVTVRGKVHSAKQEPDSDFHINLRVEPQFASMLNDANRSGENGSLVLEIVPADQSICVSQKGGSTNYALCTGANLPNPIVGEHITVTGPLVTDLVHGWNEIHPVWSWKIT